MIQIDRERCTGCGACMEACPSDAIEIQNGFAHVLEERCTDCGTCVEACPQGAIVLLSEMIASPDSQGQSLIKTGQSADRSQEIITVQLPPAPLAPPRPTPARQLGLALGAALSYLGREVAPRVLRLAGDWVEERILASREPASPATSRPRSSGTSPRRRRQRQRGRG